MHGYRGYNRLTYLLGLLFTIWSATGRAQDRPLVWYVPQSPFHSINEQARGVVAYSSWADLAQKLAQQPAQPYHLRLTLDKQTPADWQALSHIPSPTVLHLSIENVGEDTTVSAALLPTLARWSALNRLEIRADTGPRSFTAIPNGKGGEQVIQSRQRTVRLPTTGWEQLRSVREFTLDGGLDVTQTIQVLDQLPALETLTIQSWNDLRPDEQAIDLSKLTRLRTLNLNSFGMKTGYAKALRQIPWLTSLAVVSAEHLPLDELPAYLPSLEKLWLEYTDAGKKIGQLQLGKLPRLQSLRIRTNARTPEPIAVDSALAGVTTLTYLDLDAVKLAAWPPNITSNTQLKTLSLVGCGLTQLPDDLDRLGQLEDLNLDRNPIRNVPESVRKLSRLQQLSLNHCELDALPATLGNLSSLTLLTATQNSLTQLPASVGQLRNLRELNLSMNELTDLPPALGQIRTLERVAAFVNKLTRFPAELSQVRHLYLSDNELTSLPTALGRMVRLQSLGLAGNPLTQLPDEIGLLDSLETLTLGDNRLTALPPTLGKLRRLSQLDLGVNQLRSLPAELGQLTSLTAITIKNNPLEALPTTIGNWRNLRTGTFQLPYLRQLPEQVGEWLQLEDLTVDSDALILVPDALTNCRNLTTLTLVGNKLIGLPERIGNLNQLHQLIISARADSVTGVGMGQLTTLPADLVRCQKLTDLAVQQQRAFDGSDALQLATRMPGLQSLELIHCGINDLTGINWAQLPLTKLSLIDNHLSRFPTDLLRMPRLMHLNLAGNSLPPAINRFFWSKTDVENALKKTTEENTR